MSSTAPYFESVALALAAVRSLTAIHVAAIRNGAAVHQSLGVLVEALIVALCILT